MHHLEASNLLTHYLSGDLRPGRRKNLEQHLAECAECAGWVMAYSLFDEALAQHPSSIEIAGFALAPETLDPPSYERCTEHLARCRECRGEVKLVGKAIAGGRQEAEPVREENPGRLPRRRAWLALAASVVLALGAILISRTANRSPDEYLLADRILRDEETILADQSITVETTEVAPGAALTLESEVVAFGDGFSVKTGATLVVVTGESADEGDSS